MAEGFTIQLLIDEATRKSKFWKQFEASLLKAKTKWENSIVGTKYKQPLQLKIYCKIIGLDGEGGTLAEAGPTEIRRLDRLPIKGEMDFDVADIENMIKDKILNHVILHEMGHVLGIGTIWEELGLVVMLGNDNPVFIGKYAMREYQKLLGRSKPIPVPVANTGGSGTWGAHWRESIFDDELMTGIANGDHPLSLLTLGSLRDIGYRVNLPSADDFELDSDDTTLHPSCLLKTTTSLCCRLPTFQFI